MTCLFRGVAAPAASLPVEVVCNEGCVGPTKLDKVFSFKTVTLQSFEKKARRTERMGVSVARRLALVQADIWA